MKILAVITTLGMLFVLLGGALVTKTDSGDGCGSSWPLCNGELIPSDITPELVIELAHRLVSGGVGFLLLALVIWSWRTLGHIREIKPLAVISSFFLIFQALLGAAAVIWSQSEFVLALHFGISLISFASILLLTFVIFEGGQAERKPVLFDRRLRFHFIGIILYVYAVVYTGALVRQANASLVCPDWPGCSNTAGRFFPTNFYEWVQMGHRAAAGLVFVWLGYILFIVWKHYRAEKTLLYGAIAAFVLVTLQVTAGALVILTRLSLPMALAHALIISCLFGLLSYFILLIDRQRAYERRQRKEADHTSTATTN